MNVTEISYKEYLALLPEMRVNNTFQIPQIHYLSEYVSPEEYSFRPLLVTEGDTRILVPLLVRERLKGYPEFRVHFHSISANRELCPEDYPLVFRALRSRHPYRIHMAASFDHPEPFSAIADTAGIRLEKNISYVVNLPAEFETWMSGLCSQTRRKVKSGFKRVESGEMEIRKCGAEGLEDFLRIFFLRFQDEKDLLNTNPACYFHKLFEILPQGSPMIYQAFYEGKIIAAVLIIRHGRDCFAHSSAYDDEYKNLSPIYFLFGEIVRDLIAEGFQAMNFGGVGAVPSLSVMKERLGGRPFEFDSISWKDRLMEIRKSFHIPPLRSLSLKKMRFLMTDLAAGDYDGLKMPDNLEMLVLEKTEDADRLIQDGYNLKGADERGKLFMSSEILKQRLAERQMVILVFRSRVLVHCRFLVTKESLPHVEMFPPLPLGRGEAYSWHANTPAFFRKLGYHKIFTMMAYRVMKARGFKTIYAAVKDDNTPALKAHSKSGSVHVGDFYHLRWKKRNWCFGLKKIHAIMRRQSAE